MSKAPEITQPANSWQVDKIDSADFSASFWGQWGGQENGGEKDLERSKCRRVVPIQHHPASKGAPTQRRPLHIQRYSANL
jgi:hypothetical protein